MRQDTDISTMELPGVPAAKPRGKPGRPRMYASAKDRQEAYRNRKGIKLLTVELPIDVHGDFEKWLGNRGEKRGPVITRLIRSQLLRKR